MWVLPYLNFFLSNLNGQKYESWSLAWMQDTGSAVSVTDLMPMVYVFEVTMYLVCDSERMHPRSWSPYLCGAFP